MTDVNIEQNSEIDRNWAMLSHLAALMALPVLNVLGPLVVWLIKKDQSPFVAAHAKEAVNFQITVLIGVFISLWMCFILIGFILLAAIALTNFICIILAAVKAKGGEPFRYPFSLRFF